MSRVARSVSRSESGHASHSRVAVEPLLGIALAALLGMRFGIARGLTLGVVAGLALLPVWISSVASFAWGRFVMLLGATALVSGLVLTVMSGDSRGTSSALIVTTSLPVVEILVGAGVLLWARRHVGAGGVAVAYGVGMLVRAGSGGGLAGADNAWKFGWATPITVIALGCCLWWGGRAAEALVICVLAAAAAASDARSAFAILALCLGGVAWQWVRTRGKRGSALRVALALTLSAFAFYQLTETLALDGAFGAETQQRTVRQVDAAGSLIVGGRPEMAATLALMQDRPQGFGSGTQPSWHDISVAKNSMSAINYDPNNGYVERYMFGNGIVLHSVAGDLWVRFGIPGLVLAGYFLVLCSATLSRGVAHSGISALVTFLCLRTLWDLPFSPIYSSVPTLVLLVALALQPRGTPRSPGARRARAPGVGVTRASPP